MAVREIILTEQNRTEQNRTEQHSDCAFFRLFIFIKGNG